MFVTRPFCIAQDNRPRPTCLGLVDVPFRKLRAAAVSLVSGRRPQISCQGESQILTGQASLGRTEQGKTCRGRSELP